MTNKLFVHANLKKSGNLLVNLKKTWETFCRHVKVMREKIFFEHFL